MIREVWVVFVVVSFIIVLLVCIRNTNKGVVVQSICTGMNGSEFLRDY